QALADGRRRARPRDQLLLGVGDGGGLPRTVPPRGPMNAEVRNVRREVVAQAPPQVVAPADSRVRVLQLGPGLGVRGGVSSVEPLICDYLPTYGAIHPLPA